MKAYYIRTSKADNDGGAQRAELERWGQTQTDWGKARHYVDIGEAGEKEHRPQWDQLRADVGAGKVRELACTEISRLGRSVLGVILALDEIYRAECRVVLLRQGLDYATPMGRAIATILAAIAQLERDQIHDRLMAGVARAKSEGTKSGRPIGRPRVEISPSAVSTAIKMKAEGRSWADIAKGLGVAESSLRRARQNPPEK